MVVDIGGGATEVAVITLSGAVFFDISSNLLDDVTFFTDQVRLTPGQPYFIDCYGRISYNSRNQYIGTAVSQTQLKMA